MARMVAAADNPPQGRNVTAGYFFGRGGINSVIRLCTATAMMASMVYICDKNGEYIDPFWMIIRGGMGVGCVREYVKVRRPFSTIYICLFRTYYHVRKIQLAM